MVAEFTVALHLDGRQRLLRWDSDYTIPWSQVSLHSTNGTLMLKSNKICQFTPKQNSQLLSGKSATESSKCWKVWLTFICRNSFVKLKIHLHKMTMQHWMMPYVHLVFSLLKLTENYLLPWLELLWALANFVFCLQISSIIVNPFARWIIRLIPSSNQLERWGMKMSQSWLSMIVWSRWATSHSIHLMWGFFCYHVLKVALQEMDTDYPRQTGSTSWQCSSYHVSFIYLYAPSAPNSRSSITSKIIDMGTWDIQFAATRIPCSIYVVK